MENANNLKVLIADDESIVRKGLRSTVPWERFGMEVVADVPNGAKAWEAFKEHRPDIVITDIVMPEMDGIELLRRVKEAEERTKIILLSCHRDFEYAQQGIQLGASGYLLKTAFEDEELEGLLEKLRRELQRRPSPAPLDGEKLEALLFGWLSGSSGRFPAELERLRVEAWRFGGQDVHVYLVRTEGCGMPWAEWLKMKQHSSGYEAVIPYGSDACYWIVPEGLQEAANSLLIEAKGNHSLRKWSAKGPLGTSSGIAEAFRSLHKEAELERAYGVSGGDWPEPIQKAVRLLHDQPGSDWSASELAEEVGLSRSHFSILFKKSVGDSFIAFQYKRKLRLAQGLLRDTDLTMQDIAERTGLGDSKYFSKWFKRCTGQTPSQFRTVQKGESDRTV